MLVGAAIIPHGDVMIDPTLLPKGSDPYSQAVKLQLAAQSAAESIISLGVDLIVLITPHGISMEEDLGVYVGEKARGYAPIGREDKQWKVLLNVDIDTEASKELIAALRESDPPAKISGLSAFSNYDDFPLRYSEVIPLSFFLLSEELRKKEELKFSCVSPRLADQPRVIILSLPMRRYTEGQSMTAEMLQLGASLRHHLDSLQDNVALLISADLAHSHNKSGPYGYSSDAQRFDNACGDWAKSLDFSFLEKASGLLDDAMSCGYLGLVTLHGALLAGDDVHQWKKSLKAISHPTYYGMMVSTYIRKRMTVLRETVVTSREMIFTNERSL